MDTNNSPQQNNPNTDIDLDLPIVTKKSGVADDVQSLEQSGVEFVDDSNKTNAPVDTQAQDDSTSIDDLEKQFLDAAQASATPTPSKPQGSPAPNTSVLSEIEMLLEKLSKKIEDKKTKVRGEIENLKTMKEGISKEIAEIKELEETQVKLKEKKDAYQKISGEIESVEQEANDELSSF
jgi:chromosome segregation ATPase